MGGKFRISAIFMGQYFRMLYLWVTIFHQVLYLWVFQVKCYIYGVQFEKFCNICAIFMGFPLQMPMGVCFRIFGIFMGLFFKILWPCYIYGSKILSFAIFMGLLFGNLVYLWEGFQSASRAPPSASGPSAPPGLQARGKGTHTWHVEGFVMCR